MRKTITRNEKKVFTFPMTDQDVLNRVDEVNELKSQESSLERKKKIIQQEMKSLSTEAEEKLNCISRREEPREVDCDIVLNYELKTVETLYQGEVMESRKMNEWEYTNRPEDIFPTICKSKVSEETVAKGTLAEAAERAEEIMEKEANIQAPSANVNLFSEAKTETIVEGLNV